MNCANIWGPSDHSGRLQKPKPEEECPPLYKVGLKTIDTISNCSSIFRCVSISITGCVRKSRTFVKINQHIKEIQTLETNKGIEVMKTKLVKKVIMFEKVKKTNEG